MTIAGIGLELMGYAQVAALMHRIEIARRDQGAVANADAHRGAA